MELTNREKKEIEKLEELEKNNIEYSTPASAGILGLIFNLFTTKYK